MLVIGNGESRRSINLDLIKGSKIGCNAIFRDYYTDHLICVDKPILKEAIENQTTQDRKVYTRLDWVNEFKVNVVPPLPYVGTNKMDDPFNWGSGPYAVLLGAMLSTDVSLIGFDLYSIDSKINNVYKDTKNYKSKDYRAVDPRYWIYQIAKVYEHFPQTEFKIFQNDDWVLPRSWNRPNLTVDKISNVYYY